MAGPMSDPAERASEPAGPRLSSNATLAVRGLVGCVVLVIAIGVGAAWVQGFFSGRWAEEKREKARGDIELVLGALEAYKAANGRYPENLGALWVQDSRGFTYLSPKSPPRDPWKNGYQYAPPGPGETRPRVWTWGRDERAGGTGESEDVTSWEEKR